MKQFASTVGCLVFAFALHAQARPGSKTVVPRDKHHNRQHHHHYLPDPVCQHGLGHGVRETLAALENTIDVLKQTNALNPDRYLKKQLRREIRRLKRLVHKLRKQVKHRIDRPGRCHSQPATYRPMSPRAFGHLLTKVRQQPFATEKKKLLEVVLPAHFFTARQVVRMMALFSFSGDMTRVAIMMAARVLDRENLGLVHHALRFSSDQERFRRSLVGTSAPRLDYDDSRLATNDRAYQPSWVLRHR